MKQCSEVVVTMGDEESINEDELFGSGPVNWNQNAPSELELRLPPPCGTRFGEQGPVLSRGRMASAGIGANPDRNYTQAPPQANGALPRPGLAAVSMNGPQPSPSQDVTGTANTRDPVVRKKTTKNKENKIKNVNQRKQQPTDVVHDVFRSRQQEEGDQNGSWRPEIQVKRHNIEQADRRVKNTAKQEKQSKNNSIVAQGLSENTPLVNGFGRDASHLLMNGFKPDANPRNISAVYVRHRPDVAHPRVNAHPSRVDSSEYSLGAELSLDDDSSETCVKAVDKNNIRTINNDLWGRKKQDNSNVNLASLNFEAPSLDICDLETDEVNNPSPAIQQDLCCAPHLSRPSPQASPSAQQVSPAIQGVSPSVSQNQDLIASPIVLQYDPATSNQHGASQISPAMLVQNNSLTLSLDSSGQLSPSIIQSDSLLDSYTTIPSACYFGEGNSDRLYAQRLQQQFYEKHPDLLSQGYDVNSDQFQYHDNLHSDPTMEPESERPVHTVFAERIHNDLYVPPEEEHSCGHIHIPCVMPNGEVYPRHSGNEMVYPARSSNEITLPDPDGVRMRDGHILSDELYHRSSQHCNTEPMMPRNAPGPVLLPDYSVEEAGSRQGSGPGSSREAAEGVDDETFARMLQEQLNLESQGMDSDEQYARYLQDMEDDDRYRERYRGHSRDRATHQPLHTRYGRTWSRPLRVGQQPSSGQNVFDSRLQRGQGRTWDRPLQQRGAAGNHGGSDFAMLDTVYDLPTREGYDIPPYHNYYPNEYDPDYMVDDLVSININRDPHMLASLLMERAPDMMVPNNIDLNDYEALWELAEGLGEVRRVGMEEADISRLPVHTYQAPAGGESENNKTDCLVCLNGFSQGEQLRTLPCCHIYHVDCIDEWLKRNAICPVCRQSAKQGER